MHRILASLIVFSATLVVTAPPSASAAIIQFGDLGDTISVSLNGVAITGNGGRISNFTVVGEQVSFDITARYTNIVTQSVYADLLDPPGSDDPLNAVSDRIVMTMVNGAPTYHVAFGSDPDLPAIPAGALDLTTFPVQGLPPNPYYEDGTYQKVATIFWPFDPADTYFARSDVPEPASIVLLATDFAVLGYGWRRKKLA